ncbi:hypothetical protein DFP73DRAFT_483949 [Morchella snyderi]|nr:hypothetical protein DFP73DRAFT_483949 [Morchella snyderi]
MDNFFIDALVRASLCKYHSTSLPSIGIPARSRTICTIRRTPSSPHDSPTTIDIVPRPPFSPKINSELKSFSDPYYDQSYDDANKATHDDDDDDDGPPPRPYPNDPKATVRPPLPWHACTTPESRAALRLFKRHLADPAVPLETLYRSYRALPAPQILHLQLHHLNAFVARMMTVPQRTEPAMLRYLAVLDDMRAAALPVTRAEYNAAISFVARSFDSVSLDDVKSAIHLWKKSEDGVGVAAGVGGPPPAGVASDITTFNILLDMASRSDTPVLVEWLLRELSARGMAPDRFTHTTLITYHGLRGDGEGVRLAYRRLVDAGEIVDTVVLNAVMAAFLRAGQPQSAHYIYENMKRAALDPLHPLPAGADADADWVGKRRWAKMLKAVAERRRRVVAGYVKEFNASLAPDVYTFNMVILQCAKTGDYERAMELFGEMGVLGVRVDETVLVALLKGFYWYGGMNYTPWTPDRLEEVVALAFDEERAILMEKSLARWILMSTARVYNSKELVLKIWPRIAKRWVRQGGEVDPEIRGVLKDLVGHGKGA